MQSKSYTFLFLLIFLSVLGVIYYYGNYLSDYQNLDARLYFSNIRDNSSFSMKSFAERDADILVVGDSHVYSGINFNLLSDMLKNNRIAGMAMGGFYVETFLKVIERLEKKQKMPKIIFYGTSLRQFVEGRNKPLTIKIQADRINSKSKPSLLLLSKRIIRNLQKLPPYPRSYETDIELILRHKKPVDTLKEDYIIQKLSMTDNNVSGIEIWKKRISALRFSNEAQAAITSICRFTEQNDIKLFVISMPESPYLYSLYDDWQIKKYHKLLQIFSKCGARVVLGIAQDYGLGNRHFVNRKMKLDYDYEKWSRPEFIPGDADIDLDHMNLIGASKFTDTLVRKLNL